MAIIYSVGLGVDSTAALILAAHRGVKPAAIIFADTGGEKPETYHFKGILEKWIQDTFNQPLITVRNQRTRAGVVCNTLEEHCLVGHKLPSIVYGKKACSLDWKKKPVLKWCKENLSPPHIFAISYNADEQRRAIPDESKVYPLIDAGWGRLECLTAIARSPLPMPCKSACFFCPSSKKREVLDLARVHPDLAARAIAMEKNDTASNPETVQGLGRHWSWLEIIENRGGDQPSLFESAPRDCSCVEAGVTIAEYWKQF